MLPAAGARAWRKALSSSPVDSSFRCVQRDTPPRSERVDRRLYPRLILVRQLGCVVDRFENVATFREALEFLRHLPADLIGKVIAVPVEDDGHAASVALFVMAGGDFASPAWAHRYH